MRLNKTVGISLALVCAGLLVYGFEAFRVRGEAGGLSKSISPAYWIDRATGRDLFDPDKRIWYKGVHNRNEVCITFDDGPHPLSCKSILKTLKEKGVTATFFVVGKQVDGNPDLAKMIIEDGHEIGNHTYDHVRLDKLSREQVYDQINECDRAVENATGLKMTLFRPPGMRYSDTVLSVVRQKGDIMVHWVIGAKDFVGTVPAEELNTEQKAMQAITPDKIVEYVDKQLRPGAIILLHDNPVTAEALPRVIDTVRAKGYVFKSCKDMMAELPQELKIDPNPPAHASVKVVSRHN